MKCFKCASSEFKLESASFKLTVKNEPVEVVIKTNICAHCQTPLLIDEHVNILRRASADQFKRNHGLLTSQEIISFRKKFDLSQKAFAEYLGVGEASIKRWETYYIQDASQDELIRLKCDFQYAKNSLLEMTSHQVAPNLLNGMKSFSYSLFKNSALFFASQLKTTNVNLLSKLHFYADFLSYKIRKKSITGASYLSLKTGPFPETCSYEDLEKQRLLKKIAQENYQAQEEPDMSVFDDSEKKWLQYVCDCCHNQCLIRLSQLERAYNECDTTGHISYEYAEYLLI